MASGPGVLNSDRLIRVITTSPIAPKKMISVVEVGEDILVLGLTDSQITMLTKVTDEQVIQRLRKQGKENLKFSFYKQVKSLLGGYGSEGDSEEATSLRLPRITIRHSRKTP